ncbi:pentapeptide repeat-containing protein [Amycolatopsis sp. NPDC051102]
MSEADLTGANCAAADLSQANLTDAQVCSATRLELPPAMESGMAGSC